MSRCEDTFTYCREHEKIIEPPQTWIDFEYQLRTSINVRVQILRVPIDQDLRNSLCVENGTTYCVTRCGQITHTLGVVVRECKWSPATGSKYLSLMKKSFCSSLLWCEVGTGRELFLSVFKHVQVCLTRGV